LYLRLSSSYYFILLDGEAAKGKSTEENMPHMKLPSVMGGKEIELFQISVRIYLILII
jgi:hypothetical protein